MTINIYRSGTERDPACCALNEKLSNKNINVTGYII
jgi:hypothetical protein